MSIEYVNLVEHTRATHWPNRATIYWYITQEVRKIFPVIIIESRAFYSKAVKEYLQSRANHAHRLIHRIGIAAPAEKIWRVINLSSNYFLILNFLQKIFQGHGVVMLHVLRAKQNRHFAFLRGFGERLPGSGML